MKRQFIPHTRLKQHGIDSAYDFKRIPTILAKKVEQACDRHSIDQQCQQLEATLGGLSFFIIRPQETPVVDNLLYLQNQNFFCSDMAITLAHLAVDAAMIGIEVSADDIRQQGAACLAAFKANVGREKPLHFSKLVQLYEWIPDACSKHTCLANYLKSVDNFKPYYAILILDEMEKIYYTTESKKRHLQKILSSEVVWNTLCSLIDACGCCPHMLLSYITLRMHDCEFTRDDVLSTIHSMLKIPIIHGLAPNHPLKAAIAYNNIADLMFDDIIRLPKFDINNVTRLYLPTEPDVASSTGHILFKYLANEIYTEAHEALLKIATNERLRLDPSIQDWEGKTLLLLALKCRAPLSIIEALLNPRYFTAEPKTIINIADQQGHTALYYAYLYGYPEAVTLLKQHNAAVDGKFKDPRDILELEPEALKHAIAEQLYSVEIHPERACNVNDHRQVCYGNALTRYFESKANGQLCQVLATRENELACLSQSKSKNKKAPCLNEASLLQVCLEGIQSLRFAAKKRKKKKKKTRPLATAEGSAAASDNSHTSKEPQTSASASTSATGIGSCQRHGHLFASSGARSTERKDPEGKPSSTAPARLL